MITMGISFGECTEHKETDLWQYGILHAIKQTIFRRLDLDPGDLDPPLGASLDALSNSEGQFWFI